MDDEELVRAAQAGEAYAGPFLVSLYAPMLLGHARRFASDLGDDACEQIAECAVERALRRIRLFDPSRGSFLAWARSMVRYTALDYRRDHERLDHLEEVDPVDQTVPPARQVPDNVREALTTAVRQLKDTDQAILGLLEIEALPVAAVADLLGISNDAVRQRHLRARRRLAAVAESDPILRSFVEGAST